MSTCQHRPSCPSADGPDRNAARVISAQPALGWSLLCNGVVVVAELAALDDSRAVAAHRPAVALHAAA